ncbi:MAG: hypothetical protein ACRD97_06685 [Nitrososphaeraceae archaeon]
MTRKYNYYPRGTFQFLNDLAFKNNLAVKEVETILLRKQMEHLGFTCDHTNVAYSEEKREPYCKNCWTRLEQTKPPTYFKGKLVKAGEYWPLETFLDGIYKEEARKAKADLEARIKAEVDAGIKAVVDAARQEKEKQEVHQ